MTAERSGTGTATYRPPVAGGANIDVFGLANPAQRVPLGGRAKPPRYQVSKITDDLYYWRIELHSAVRGVGKHLRGRFDEVHDFLASSTLDSRFGLILPQLTTVTATPDPNAVSDNILSWANVFSTLVIASGYLANSAIFQESATGVISAITHTVTNTVTSLTGVRLNNDEILIVGRIPTVARAWTDLTGAASTDMHANTIELWGAIQTPINAETILLYARQSIWTLAGNAALAGAPTEVLTNVPGGGYAVGLCALGGAPLRAYWVWPTRAANAFSEPILSFGNEREGKIVSTNLQGTDPQELKLPIKYVKFAALWNDGIITSDGERIIFHNGRTISDLRIFANRVADSDKVYRVRSFFINGTELIAKINLIASTGGAGNTVEWSEAYVPEADAWIPVTAKTTLTSTGLHGFMYGSLPVSNQTGFCQSYSDGSWRRFLATTPGIDPYTLRKTDGAQAATGIAYEASGAATWPAFQIPGIEGWPMSVRRISGNPQIDIGGGTPTTNPTVAITVGGVTATFIYNETQGRQEFGFWGNEHVTYELQPVVTLTQQAGGTDPTRQTSQAFPLIIEGVASRPKWANGPVPTDYTR